MPVIKNNINVSLFIQSLNKCETFSQLECLHSSLCRQLSAKRREVFIRMIDEHHEKLARELYWDTIEQNEHESPSFVSCTSKL